MTTLPLHVGARAWLEVAGRFPPEIPLEGERITVGRSDADVELPADSVSRLHAVFERLSSGWIVHDLGSTNGTTLNGVRVAGARVIRDGDVLCLGSTALTFRCADDTETALTAPPPAAPHVTRRERELLVALCRPVLVGEMLTEPAGLRQIAQELVISESAVKKLLARTYDAFGLTENQRRRAFLAAEALRRGVITVRDA
jgi:hypothetical protein